MPDRNLWIEKYSPRGVYIPGDGLSSYVFTALMATSDSEYCKSFLFVCLFVFVVFGICRGGGGFACIKH